MFVSLCRLRFLLPVKYVLFLLQVGGQDSPDVATSINNIGAVYEKKGDYENALVQHQKGLEIRTRVFGSDHPAVAGSYTNIGNVYNSHGQYERALEYYQKSLEIDMKVSGQDHPDVAMSKYNIAV